MTALLVPIWHLVGSPGSLVGSHSSPVGCQGLVRLVELDLLGRNA